MRLDRFSRAALQAPWVSIPSRMGNAKFAPRDKSPMDTGGRLRWAMLALLAMGAGCGHPPPEARLHQTLEEMQQALEQRQPARFMAHVAEDFAGNDAIDRGALQQTVRAQLLLNRKIGVVTGPVTVEMGQKRARADFQVVVTGGRGRLLPERASTWQVATAWRDEDGQWKLQFARWERR